MLGLQDFSPETVFFLIVAFYFLFIWEIKMSVLNFLPPCLLGFFMHYLQTCLRVKSMEQEKEIEKLFENARKILEEEKEFEAKVRTRVSERSRKKQSQAESLISERAINENDKNEDKTALPATKNTDNNNKTVTNYSLDDENFVLINNIILKFMKITQSVPYMDEEIFETLKQELMTPFALEKLTSEAISALNHAERLMHNHYQACLKRCEFYCSSKLHRCEDNQFHFTNKRCFSYICPMFCQKFCEICKEKFSTRCGNSEKLCRCASSNSNKKGLSRRATFF